MAKLEQIFSAQLNTLMVNNLTKKSRTIPKWSVGLYLDYSLFIIHGIE